MNKPKKRFTGESYACKRCGEHKPIDAFDWDKNRPSPRSVCKACRYRRRDIRKENEASSERKAAWREINRDRLRVNWERSKYGVAKEDMGETACRICHGTQRLSIDHCHASGKVRGLLCSPCNVGLGNFRDREDLLLAAILYLQGKLGPKE